jgi:hypothetical protein
VPRSLTPTANFLVRRILQHSFWILFFAWICKIRRSQIYSKNHELELYQNTWLSLKTAWQSPTCPVNFYCTTNGTLDIAHGMYYPNSSPLIRTTGLVNTLLIKTSSKHMKGWINDALCTRQIWRSALLLNKPELIIQTLSGTQAQTLRTQQLYVTHQTAMEGENCVLDNDESRRWTEKSSRNLQENSKRSHITMGFRACKRPLLRSPMPTRIPYRFVRRNLPFFKMITVRILFRPIPLVATHFR